MAGAVVCFTTARAGCSLTGVLPQQAPEDGELIAYDYPSRAAYTQKHTPDKLHKCGACGKFYSRRDVLLRWVVLQQSYNELTFAW